MEKKAIVAIIQATGISAKPTKTIVSMAPIKKIKPAVSKRCSPVFCASIDSDRLIRIDASRKKMNATTNAATKTKILSPIPTKEPAVKAPNMPPKANPPKATPTATRAIT